MEKKYRCKDVGMSLQVMSLNATISSAFVSDDYQWDAVKFFRKNGYCRDDDPSYANKLLELVEYTRHSDDVFVKNNIPPEHFDEIEQAAMNALNLYEVCYKNS